MRETERDFQKAVIHLAKLRGWLVHAERPARTAKGWRTPIQGDPGFPDLVLVRRPRIIFAELKTDAGKLSLNQLQWLEAIEAAVVWRPKDWSSIEEMLA